MIILADITYGFTWVGRGHGLHAILLNCLLFLKPVWGHKGVLKFYTGIYWEFFFLFENC